MVRSWRGCIGEGEVEVEGEKSSWEKWEAPSEIFDCCTCPSDACVGAAARLRARTETGFGRHVQVSLRMLWILIGEGDERSDVQNLDGNAAGQVSYRPAGLPFPTNKLRIWRLRCASRDQALSKVERSNMLNLDGNAAGQGKL